MSLSLSSSLLLWGTFVLLTLERFFAWPSLAWTRRMVLVGLPEAELSQSDKPDLT